MIFHLNIKAYIFHKVFLEVLVTKLIASKIPLPFTTSSGLW
jgi:hypothetical protein